MSNKLFASNSRSDSLIKYVLDVKPYHTKLSEVVEEFIFEDSFSAGFNDSHRTLAVLGPDYLARSTNANLNVWANASIRPLSNMSADRYLRGDGRRVFKIPPVVINKLLSTSQQERNAIKSTSSSFQPLTLEDGELLLTENAGEVLIETVGTADNTASEILGLFYGVFSQREFVGPGIPRVLLDGVGQAEGSGYHISLGAYSFDTIGSTWRSKNVPEPPETATYKNTFPYNEGALAYSNIRDPLVTIKNISSTTYEEWTLVWDAINEVLVVSGSSSGVIGSAPFNEVFVHEKLTFNFIPTSTLYSPESAAPLADNQKFTLTPRAKITVAQHARAETWTLIKTNPQAVSDMVFTGTPTNAALNVFAQSVYETPESTWTVTFTSPTTYVINSSLEVSTYPVTHNMATGSSYKDANMHFAVSTDDGFNTGDKFEFKINGRKPNYLVFGSVSGWQPSAHIGEWYWNGKIGFKIPSLEYFAFVHSELGNSLATETGHVLVDEVSGKILGASNDIDTLARTFVPGKKVHPSVTPSVYQVKFRENISSSDVSTATVFNNIYGYKHGLKIGDTWEDEFAQFKIDNAEFRDGDQIDVFIAHAGTFRTASDSINLISENNLDLAGGDNIPLLVSGSGDSSVNNLYPLGKHEEYFPLYHSYGCVIIPAVTSAEHIVIIDKVERELVQFKLVEDLTPLPLSLAVSEESFWIPLEYRFNSVFPDYVSTVEVFLGSNPDVKVFEIKQPRASNGYPDSAVLEFNPVFYNQFVAGNPFVFRFNQASSYQQRLRVKVSETLRIFATINLNDLTDSMDVGNIIALGYDESPYDESPYNLETSAASISESLQIIQSAASGDPMIHSVYGPQHSMRGLHFSRAASIYTVTHNENFDQVLIITDSGSSFNVTPDYTPYPSLPTSISVRSFSFTVPANTGPFKLLLTGGTVG